MSPALAGLRSSMSTTIRPLERSCAATACLSPASISPLVAEPLKSRALNAYVAIAPYATLTVPIRRRSSSGAPERDSASSRVILCSRTSCTSEASIVCMPNCPPVWSAE